jgi:hypothetical protein
LLTIGNEVRGCRPVGTGDFAAPAREAGEVKKVMRPVGWYRTAWLSTCTVLTILVGVSVVAARSSRAITTLSMTFGLLGIAALLSSPAAVRTYGRWLRLIPIRFVAHLNTWATAMACVGPGYVAWQPPPQLCDLTDEELSKQWRASYLALQGRVPDRQFMRTVNERERYLDEFERRNPQGFTAWLASGPWASSIPTPYLNVSRSDYPGIDWDELIR